MTERFIWTSFYSQRIWFRVYHHFALRFAWSLRRLVLVTGFWNEPPQSKSTLLWKRKICTISRSSHWERWVEARLDKLSLLLSEAGFQGWSSDNRQTLFSTPNPFAANSWRGTFICVFVCVAARSDSLFFFLFFFLLFFFFLDASSHLYMRVCPSVRMSVCPSVCPSVGPSVSIKEKTPKSPGIINEMNHIQDIHRYSNKKNS